MSKRSNFERIEKDFYPTFDPRAGRALAEYINPKEPINYAEPCYGDGDLETNLKNADPNFNCIASGDISVGKDMFDWNESDLNSSEMVITNPPWTRVLLHPMIEHFAPLKPTWLLFDSDWAYTKQSKKYMELCTDIVAVGRLIWMRDTKVGGKDNCSWYRFSTDKNTNTRFQGR